MKCCFRIVRRLFSFRLLFTLLSFLLLTCCTGYQYVSSPAYVPQHTAKGEGRVNLYLNGAQAGYSPINHLMFFTTAHYHSAPGGKGGIFEEKDEDRFRKTISSDFTIGSGWYARRDRIVYEVIAGAGLGKIDYANHRSRFYGYSLDMKANTQHYYIQPDIGFSVLDHFNFTVFVKTDFCRYTHITNKLSLGAYGEPEFSDQEFMRKSHVDVVMLSPGFSFQGGWKMVRFHAQLSPNFMLSGGDNIRYQPLNLNLGASLLLSAKHKTN